MPENFSSGLLSGLKYLAPVITAAFFVLLLLLEMVLPLRRRKRSLALRIAVNLCISGVALGTGALIAALVSHKLSAWTWERSFGLLHIVPLPFPVQFAMGFLLLDLTFYYWHQLNHAVPLLWRFHNVHHIDPDLDVSTSFRFHLVKVKLKRSINSRR